MFEELFGSPGVDDRAWLTAMLDAERALASAQAQAGVIPADAAAAIVRSCSAGDFDAAGLGREAVSAGNPVVPLVKELRSRVPDDASRYVHFGATSQDIMDTAASLVASRALVPLLADVEAAAAQCASLADEHRDTVMIARTLMQHALPTVFGLKCAGWLVALDEAAAQLRRVELAVQLGGAAGTLAVFEDLRVPDRFAAELGLAAPVLPWHTDRTRFASLATALGVLAGVLGKIALDVTLMAQTEVAEVSEATGGGSSAMPHKQNPVRAVLITAAVRQVPGLVSTMLSAMVQEHERAAGAWHAEWETLGSLLRLVGAAAARTRDLLAGLRVDRERMRANVNITGGLVMTEALANRLGRDLVTKLSQSGEPLREALRAHLSDDEIDELLDPANYLGSAGEMIDRALRRGR